MSEEKSRKELLAELGQRIADLRKLQGLTQKGLGEASGVSKDFISKLERGETNVSVENLDKLSHSLQIKMSDYFTDPEEAERENPIKRVVVRLERADGKVQEFVCQPETD